MINSSIHADMPENFPRNLRTGVLLLFGDLVVTVLLPANVYIGPREIDLGVDLKGRERVVN